MNQNPNNPPSCEGNGGSSHLPKALIVDDVPANIHVLRRALEPQGYQVSIATNGMDALRLAPSIQPDIILLDVMMPGINGFETCRELKKFDEFRDIPVIFITAKDDVTSLAEGFQAGGVDYITKPFKIEEITHRIRTHYRVSRLTRELARKNQDLEAFSQKLQAAKEEADRANQAKSLFLAKMTHEIRTPMSGVMGIADLLLESHLPNHQSQMVETIRISGESLLSLINDILDFSKLDSGAMELVKKPFSLVQTLEECLDIFTGRIKSSDLDLVLDLDLELIDGRIGDPDRLKQILINLIGNAIKFTSRGFIRIGVSALDESQKRLRFNVEDSGIGIDPDQIKHLFEPYRQAHPGISGSYGGTGIGLSICKSLSELMGGFIEAKSQPGLGSTFSFEVELHPDPSVSKSDRFVPAIQSETLHHAVVIEDGDPARRNAISLLKQLGMSASGARNLSDALLLNKDALTADGRPWIVLDWNLPEVEGTEALNQIRDHLDTESAAPALLLMDWKSKSELLKIGKIKELGPVEIVTKPIKPSQFSKALQMLISGTDPEFCSSGEPDQKDADNNLNLDEYFPLNILILDDNEVNRLVAEQIFLKLGYLVTCVETLTQAIDELTRNSYDLALIDLWLGEGASGLELMPQLKPEGKKSVMTKPWLIGWSARKTEEDTLKVKEAGMLDLILKPLRIQTARNLITDLQAMETSLTSSVFSARLSEVQPEEENISQPESSTFIQQEERDYILRALEWLGWDNEKEKTFSSRLDVPCLNEVIKDDLELLGIYLSQGENLIQELEESVSGADPEKSLHCLHKLAGSSGSCGFSGFQSQCSELENRLHMKPEPVSEETFDSVQQSFQEIREFIHAVNKNP